MPVQTELYDILEISPSATADEIKKAYRKKALQHHPDKGGQEDQFKKVNHAYEILSNPEKRMMYDKGDQDIPVPNVDMFNAMFGNLFGGNNIFNMFQNMSKTMRKSPTFTHTYNVTLENLCTRKVCKLKVDRDRICQCYKDCQTCTNCKGTGSRMVIKHLGPNMIQQTNEPCTVCQGEGKICNYCDKCVKGVINESKVFELFLTPDMKDGYNYVFQNEGNQIKGYEPGDFIIIIKHLEHPVFKVDGKNLIYTHKLTLKEALCGHTISITHPGGYSLNFVSGTVITPESQTTLENGLYDNGKLIIKYNIIFPEKIDPSVKQILSQLNI